ncbi:hypothetical protein OU787_22310 [Kitasatospora sp. YST-16]|uniref:hypothetical protein n=1 Tax=Kitasatospora sp. YST-16 TaxID=2998080 RepID=UPI002283BBB2|nr:hypothetical protein [Kitasatospora sp. YST-16]WAL73991.1 hypothetical protein OU787_22310 [Kitasatospora sp. YST-16]WNW40066.1 hypothetical protein RKE32_22275 [Streptomyces sp. Li-HN-5-13]
MTELLDALARVDAVFAPYAARPFALDGCGYCYTAADLALLAGPPALVPDRLLHEAATEVPDHWSDFPGLYRRLLPRVLRRVALDGAGPDPATVASRLLAAGWGGWPERPAVERFLRAWWERLVERPSERRPTEALELLVPLTGSPVPWLERWTAHPDERLSRTVDRWLERRLEVRSGLHDEAGAAPAELAQVLLALGPDFLGAHRLREVERIAWS